MYNRAEIMKAAWVIVRRFAGNRETLVQRLSRALRSTWCDAKRAVEVARRASAAIAAKIARFAGKSVADLQSAIAALENSDWLGRDGLERLSDTRAALTVAMVREASEIIAFAPSPRHFAIAAE